MVPNTKKTMDESLTNKGYFDGGEIVQRIYHVYLGVSRRILRNWQKVLCLTQEVRTKQDDKYYHSRYNYVDGKWVEEKNQVKGDFEEYINNVPKSN